MKNNELIKFEGGLIKRVGNAISVTNKLLSLSEPQIIPYRKKDKWGFCTPDKKVVIDCVYEETYRFSEKLACVKLNNKLGFIDINGNQVIDCIYDFEFWGVEFKNGLARVALNEKKGFIDKKGDTLFPLMLDYYPESSFINGLLPVKIDEKYGFINSKGEIVIKCVYDSASSFSEGLSAIGFHKWKKEEKTELSKEEKLKILNSIISSIDLNEKPKQSSFYGFIDKYGKTIIPCKYNFAKSFSHGLANVELDNKWGFIDKSGEVTIPLIYDNATSYNEGLASVCLDSRWGCIDNNGQIVIPLQYDFRFSFNEGMAIFRKGKNGKSPHNFGVLNKSNEVVIPPIYYSLNSFSEGLAAFRTFGWERPYGFLDKLGNIIISGKYRMVDNFSNGYALIRKDLITKLGYINKQGIEYWED